MKTAVALVLPCLAAILTGCKFCQVSGICYYVHPLDQEDLCPPNSSHICFTFTDYAVNSSYYFTSNATEFYFIGSKHHLKQSATFSDLTDIKLRGDTNGADSLVEIDCDSVGFEFVRIVKLLIANLKFLHCSMTVQDEGVLSGLFFHSITDLTIEQVIVQNTTGYGVYMKNIYGYSSINNSIYNHSGDTPESLGGNIYLGYTNCSVNKEVSFSI